jgi:hypothetical protein
VSYFHLPTSTARNPGRLEAKLSDGYQISAPDGRWSPELAALCGFVPIVTVDRPADTPTHTSDRSVVDAVEVWTVRPKTAGELAAQTADANRATIEAAVTQHLSDLAAIANSSGTLTGAQLSNAVRVLARGQRRILRVLHNRLDAAD